MSLDDLAYQIQNILNDVVMSYGYEFAFKITPIEQMRFPQAKTADGEKYVSGALRELPMPLLTEYHRTRQLAYQVNVKGSNKHRKEIKQVVDEAGKFDYLTFGNLIIDETSSADAGLVKEREFTGYFRVNLYVPVFITGRDFVAWVDIDGNLVDLEAVSFSGIFSKGLIPNRPFGSNESAVMTGEDITLSLPLNDKTKGIFAHIINQEYNKVYTFLFDFKAVSKLVDLVVVGGNIAFDTNHNTLVFNVVLERALSRQDIKINGTTVNVIGFMPSVTIAPATKVEGNKVKMLAENVTNTFTFQLENDNSQVVRDIIDEINNHSNRMFTVSYVSRGITYSHDCILQSGSEAVSENPNAIINVVFGVGAF